MKSPLDTDFEFALFDRVMFFIKFGRITGNIDDFLWYDEDDEGKFYSLFRIRLVDQKVAVQGIEITILPFNCIIAWKKK